MRSMTIISLACWPSCFLCSFSDSKSLLCSSFTLMGAPSSLVWIEVRLRLHDLIVEMVADMPRGSYCAFREEIFCKVVEV